MKKTVSKKSTSKKSTVAKKSPAKKSSIPAKKSATKRSSPVAPAKQPPGGKTAARATQPLRFAHPFFTPTPLSQRTVVPGVGTRLLDYIQGNLEPVPAPTRTPLFTLADIIGQPGAQQIQASGSIRFHTCGDTGRGANSPQGVVAEAMTTDYDTAHPETSPAFFFHLGDVIYGINKDQQYRPEFYEPYVHYPGKIVGIAGNHDGEVFSTTDPATLRAFLANFCAPAQVVPPIAGTIFRQTMNQPGVYYLLDAPFMQIVALYSNAAENPGFISGPIPGQAQKTWLLATLKTIAAQRKSGTRKALIFATHHPPFTAGGHAPSTDMLADIDSVCQQAGIMPDLFLSGHAHSYQRYTREISLAGKALQIPYVVAGIGGINDQAVPTATGQQTGDHIFVKSLKGYGYLLISVSATTIKGTMYSVDPNTTAKSAFETFTVDLTRSIVS
jgi:Calcineurin-like phosphoesterase